MSTKRPPRCHFDRPTRERLITRRHLDDCPDRATCDGCQPCEEDHCVLCRSRHSDDQHPLVCDHCVGAIRQDLKDIAALCKQLRAEAAAGGSDGRLVAAAPIPGGDAMVLIGPSSSRVIASELYASWQAGLLKKQFATYGDDHRLGDPLPPLALLADWEDIWRRHLQVPSTKRASIHRSLEYFDQHLTLMAQLRDGPDITVFARDIQTLRSRLEGVLHDEDQPERGVECFDCGVRLVRRIRDGKPCRCGPRPVLRHAPHGQCDCLTGVRIEWPDPEKGPDVIHERRRDPDDEHIHTRPDLCCIACHREDEWDRRHASHSQGGVDDSRPGFAWECPGCRKKYSPGEYARAVRQDLADSHRDEDGRQIGWTTLPIAAAAAAERTGRSISANTLRVWAQRALDRERVCAHPTRAREWLAAVESYPELGEPWGREKFAALMPCSRCREVGIGTACQWVPGRRLGTQLVFWPDVLDRATETRRKGRPERVA